MYAKVKFYKAFCKFTVISNAPPSDPLANTEPVNDKWVAVVVVAIEFPAIP